MATMIRTGNDAISFLTGQHQDIQRALYLITDTHGEGRARAFFTLRRMVAVHETAEEEVVHPAARRILPGGEAIVRARLSEEKDAKAALAALEALDLDSAEFETKFDAMKIALLSHLEAEERDEFAGMRETVDLRRLEWMRRAVQVAEWVAPTRPRAGVESAAANFLVGPWAAVVDRSRDALFSRR